MFNVKMSTEDIKKEVDHLNETDAKTKVEDIACEAAQNIQTDLITLLSAISYEGKGRLTANSIDLVCNLLLEKQHNFIDQCQDALVAIALLEGDNQLSKTRLTECAEHSKKYSMQTLAETITNLETKNRRSCRSSPRHFQPGQTKSDNIPTRVNSNFC